MTVCDSDHSHPSNDGFTDYNEYISKGPMANQIVRFARPLNDAEQALAACLIDSKIKSDTAKRQQMAALGHPVSQNDLLILSHSLRSKVNAPAGTSKAVLKAKLQKALAQV